MLHADVVMLQQKLCLCLFSDCWRARKSEWQIWKPRLSRKTVARGRCSKKRKKKLYE